MALYKTITVNPNTKVLIWKIEESYEELEKGLTLTPKCLKRLESMKSDIHQKGFLSIRQLLKLAGYTPYDLYYDENGKPHLIDGKEISITHSFQFSSIIIGQENVGIDIEMMRPKILRIANKFTILEAYQTLGHEEAIVRKLTMVWCAKEALYKMYATPGLSFLQHIDIHDFFVETYRTLGNIIYQGKVTTYEIYFEEMEGFMCGYALKID
ncbi:4'-phosphopantetheinyl transferase family protein [Imtechella halotolerans]|uniref:4'-phosphopantetheinyl transferase n=1 Tax=Imtechella halotolerans K1 TaxID=946077 RepID=I0WK19_9FLAO|nr:4'-phosphopantetheinyl transferase superfamily protein [Imtechella halotolerans]EID76735.1 4'-phosphopantetheinyl transferase [Imtechella halotolerans K1]WMQ62698.1 4'-phosphopantetheinyl transferase superfamily protein [Imtechella halotolerans]